MNNEELAVLAKEDKDKLNELISINQGIVRKLAGKYYTEKTSSLDYDDLVQEGLIGLMYAVEKYDPEKANAAAFITFAVYNIRGRMSRYMTQRNTNEEQSLNEPVKKGVEGNLTLLDTIVDDQDEIEEIERRLYVKQLRNELNQVMIQHLTLGERELLKLWVGWDNNEGMPLSEVADLYNITVHQAHNKKTTALAKMRRTKWFARLRRERQETVMRRKYDNAETLCDAIALNYGKTKPKTTLCNKDIGKRKR